MSDPIGTFLSWTVLVTASAYVVYHWARTIRLWRLETESAVAIMFGTGLLVTVVPKKVYPDLPPAALDALNWLAVVMILAAMATDLLAERDKRNAASRDASSLDPRDKR